MWNKHNSNTSQQHDRAKVESYLPKVFRMIFERLRQRKSTQLCCEFIVCLSLFVLRNGFSLLQEILDQIQPKIKYVLYLFYLFFFFFAFVSVSIMVMIINNVWIPYARKIEDLLSRRVLTMGMIRMISDKAFIEQNELRNAFPRMIQLIIEIFEIKPQRQLTTEEECALRIEALEDQGFGSKFTALSYAKPQPFDITSGMEDPRKMLVAKTAEYFLFLSDFFVSFSFCLMFVFSLIDHTILDDIAPVKA
ncbi:hypothetical protein RFI_29189 [Reticulomyxa filosa]|uniref:Exportin-2 C-terminal domain-containing protein n=1 Tax=Reticulomyxa filosa TaxID=46433 RepID=X6M2Q2_RETFI|nr:hypothetical protein RFI_29189 [Reticulomyxa filosa]|eukprot:ETO08199.1 hypothetical protein RFI_29189 [Reticulomyxa filosa]